MEKESIHLVFLNITIEGGFSGVNRYLEMMSRGLAAYPHIIVHTVYLLEKKDMLFPDIRQEGESVHAILPFPLNTRPIIKEDFWMTKYAGVIADQISPYFRGKRHLIWNVHCINLTRLAVILRERHGGKILTYLHCIPWKFEMEGNPKSFNRRYRKFLNRDVGDFNDSAVEKLTYEAADHIVCVTRSAQNYLTEFMHVAPEKITIITNGLERMEVAFEPQERSQQNELLYVGRLSKEKGVPDLLKALRRVKRAGYHCRLTLAGAGHPALIRKWKENYPELELDFTGQLPFTELVCKYKTCTLGIIPSLHEQCSYVALEMAMFGVPLVVSDVDGLGEMFVQRQTALQFPLKFDDEKGLSADIERMATALMYLLHRPRFRNELSKNVQQHYSQYFTAETMIQRSITLYNQIICLK